MGVREVQVRGEFYGPCGGLVYADEYDRSVYVNNSDDQACLRRAGLDLPHEIKHVVTLRRKGWISWL